MRLNEFIKVGSVIKKIRKSKGISQKYMAEVILNIPKSTYSNYENDNRIPDGDTLQKIAESLGTTVQSILSVGNAQTEEDKEILLSRIEESQARSKKKEGINALAKVYDSFLDSGYIARSSTLEKVYKNENFQRFLWHVYNLESEKEKQLQCKALGIEVPETPQGPVNRVVNDLDVNEFVNIIATMAIEEYQKNLTK